MLSDGGRLMSWDGHLLLVYDNERQRRDGVAAWARRGLDLDAKVVYIEPPQESAERSFLGVLKEHEIDANDALERGQIQIVPADASAYSPTWQASMVEAALADGYPTVRWSGEAVTAWRVISPAVHADIEWATDELCHTRPVSILCQYSSGLARTPTQAVFAMHEDGVRSSQLQTSPIPGGMAVAGEVDTCNERILRTALMAACAGITEGQGSFVVELSQVDFLDVAGVRAFMTGTAVHRGSGGTVCLRAAQRRVDRLLRLLGVDRAEGFVVEGPR
jgi:anti-anti-sigma factor